MEKMAVQQGFPRISSVYDHENGSPHSLLHSGSIRSTLMKLLPSDFFFSDDASSKLVQDIDYLVPIFKWVEWGESKHFVSIFLLCRHRANGIKFFFEMISRWLIPGKRATVSSFFAVDFQFPELGQETFTVSEIVATLESAAELEFVRHQLPILESEIRLGLISVYHANRILEIKGLSADEKTSLIQERIVSLLDRRPQDFDHDIFTQMQHFLVMCSEEFKIVRDHAHMSRIVTVFYLFKKSLKRRMEANPGQRFIHVKLSTTYLHLPFGLKRVVAVFVGLNLQGASELFDEKHLAGALRNLFPLVQIIEDSYISFPSKDERVQLLYVELEKTDGGNFTLSEMRTIREKLPDEVHGGIEKLTRPLFMPRNEEEVMRNIIILSNQLKLSRDLPQVMIAFDEQSDEELVFTVIWMRVVKPFDAAIQESFADNRSFLRFIPDRVKRVGLLRKKIPKEVTVFRVRFDGRNFLRSDHSVDLFKARQEIVQELQRLLGEFRDYNGGMIAKQHEQFLSLKSVLRYKDDLLLENFFHSLFPIELRSFFNLELLKDLFNFLMEAVQKNKETKAPICLKKDDPHYCILLFSYEIYTDKEKFNGAVEGFQIPSSRLLTLSQKVLETAYLGYIYLEENPQKRLNFLKDISLLWENLTFDP